MHITVYLVFGLIKQAVINVFRRSIYQAFTDFSYAQASAVPNPCGDLFTPVFSKLLAKRVKIKFQALKKL